MVPLLLTLAISASTAPSQSETPPAAPSEAPCVSSTFTDCLVLTLGLGVFGDVTVLSSVSSPSTGRPQRSLLGGARFWIGTRWPQRVALRAVFDFGYVTVGPFPTRGSDGIFEAAGVELTLDLFSRVKPFVRFMYEGVVQRIAAVLSRSDDGILRNNALAFHVGAMISVVDVHLTVGRDFAGGFSPGLGFSVAWLN